MVRLSSSAFWRENGARWHYIIQRGPMHIYWTPTFHFQRPPPLIPPSAPIDRDIRTKTSGFVRVKDSLWASGECQPSESAPPVPKLRLQLRLGSSRASTMISSSDEVTSSL